MLRWTPRGAVSLPTTLQLRVERAYPGRIRAGAPVPSRGLTPAELTANLRHFTEGQRGPRTKPCTGLVLSGAGVIHRPDLPAALQEARDLGLARIVVHTDTRDLTRGPAPVLDDVDRVVLPLGEVAATRAALRGPLAGHDVVVHTVLHRDALDRLDALAELLLAARPAGAAWTFPYPGTPGPLVPPDEAVRRLSPTLRALRQAGIATWVNGLPACFLGEHAQTLRRAANRWYVDADHQGTQALLFFPDVLRFHKGETCRFCSADPVCDGFFQAWLRQPGWPPLRPLTP